MTSSEKPWTARRIEAIAWVAWAWENGKRRHTAKGECVDSLTPRQVAFADDVIAADPLEPIAAALYEALEAIAKGEVMEPPHVQAVARSALALANGEGG